MEREDTWGKARAGGCGMLDGGGLVEKGEVVHSGIRKLYG